MAVCRSNAAVNLAADGRTLNEREPILNLKRQPFARSAKFFRPRSRGYLDGTLGRLLPAHWTPLASEL